MIQRLNEINQDGVYISVWRMAQSLADTS